MAEATKKRLGGSTWRYHFTIIRMSYVDMSTCPCYQSCQFQSKIAQIAKVTKIPTCSAIRDGAVHSEESSKGSRGTSCSNKRTYQDHQVYDDDYGGDDDDIYIMLKCMSVCLSLFCLFCWEKLFWQVRKLFWQVGKLF